MKIKLADTSKLNLGIAGISMLPFLYIASMAHRWSAESDVPTYILKNIHNVMLWGLGFYIFLIVVKAIYERGIPLRSVIIAGSIAFIYKFTGNTMLAWIPAFIIVLYDIELIMTGEGKNIVSFSVVGSVILTFAVYATTEIVRYEMIGIGGTILLLSELLLSPPMQSVPKVKNAQAIDFIRKLVSKEVLAVFLPFIPLMFIYEISKGFQAPVEFLNITIYAYTAVIIIYTITFIYSITRYCPLCGFYSIIGTLLYIFAWYYKVLLNGHSLVAFGVGVLGISLLHIGLSFFAEVTTRIVIAGIDIIAIGLLILAGRFMLFAGDFMNNLLQQMPIETIFITGISDIVGIGMVLSGLNTIREKLAEWRR
ncbi:hypothetical protein GM182_06535 [bacterium 3DAC]|nr:hypothetical protein GM182_06535 [bacterium 3DAC]